jgi:hypothetical protein
MQSHPAGVSLSRLLKVVRRPLELLRSMSFRRSRGGREGSEGAGVAGGAVRPSLARRGVRLGLAAWQVGSSVDAGLGGAMSQTIVVLVFIGLALWWDRQ